MVQTLVFSLIYGPVAVTLGCWLFCAIGAARARQEAEVILNSSRDWRASFEALVEVPVSAGRSLGRSASALANPPCRQRDCRPYSLEPAAEAHRRCQRRRLASQQLS